MSFYDPIVAQDYLSNEVLERELNLAFSSQWQLVACTNDVPDTGSFVVVEIGSESVVVINDNGELKALSNICRHRGHPLVSGSGTTSQLVCPYHQWRYQTNGALLRAPNSKRVEGFETESICLPSYPLKQMGAFIFVCLSDDTPFPEEQFQPLISQLENRLGELGNFSEYSTRSYEVKSNWKVVMDNYLECYHCGVGHQSFCEVMALPSYQGTIGAQWSMQTAEYKGPLTLDELAPQQWAFFTVYPNMILNVTPGVRQLNFMQAVPVGPELTRVELRTWKHPDSDAVMSTSLAEVILDVKREDIAYCEAVQQGYHSRHFTQGIVMADEHAGALSERAVLHFHQWLSRLINT